ncbi:MAG: NADH-quinone oxidoreductase subunit J [Anaerolineae bacterium]|jgi:NADH-quinone oxidoreductase subunit J|nr:NADH-quinone oxidoreductase subunit J [Anaerolineae bacterium]
MQQLMFIVISAVTLISAALVVTTRSLFRSALWLILTFFGIAGLFILLHAEFLAIAQILIYVGAISTLIIFAIMLSRGVMDPNARRFNDQWGLVAGFAAVFFVLLTAIMTRVPWQTTMAPAPMAAEAIQLLGRELVTPYAIPFEVASVLLVVAMIGAIIVARERES